MKNLMVSFFLILFFSQSLFATNPASTVLVSCDEAFAVEASRGDYSNFCYTKSGYLWKPKWDADISKVLTATDAIAAESPADSAFSIANSITSLATATGTGGFDQVANGYRLPTIKELTAFIDINESTSFGRWFHAVPDNTNANGADYILSSSYAPTGEIYALNIASRSIEKITVSAAQKGYVLGVSKFVQIKNKSTGKCLEVKATKDQADHHATFLNINGLSCDGEEIRQRWRIYNQGAFVKIKSMYLTDSEHCIEFGNDYDGNVNDHVRVYTCNDAQDNAQWVLNADDSIKKNNNRGTGYMTDDGDVNGNGIHPVNTAAGADGATSPNDNQKWIIY
jgi:hypothetical protein